MTDSIPCIHTSIPHHLSHSSMHPQQAVKSVRDYFTSSKTGSSSASGTQKTAMPSSLPFEMPSNVAFHHSSSSTHNSPSSRSTTSSSRGKKRDRHEAEEEEEAASMEEKTTRNESMDTEEIAAQPGMVRVGSEVRSLPPSPSSSSVLVSAPRLILSKLSSRTLLYQLHVLRADELMLLRAVDGGGVEMQLSNDLTEEALIKRSAQVEQKAAAESLAEQKDTVKMFGGGSSLVTDSGMILDWQTSGSSSVPIQEPHNASSHSEALASPATIQSSPSPAPALSSHPLFPDSLDYVTLYTSTTAAHNAFLKIQKEWSRKGVTNVKERIIEFQLTTPARLLVIGTPNQRTHWIDASTSASAVTSASLDDSVMTASESLPAIRASPFHKPPPRSAAVQTVDNSHLVVSSAISGKEAAFPTFPALYSNPHISSALRTVLDRNEGEIEGFCATKVNASSEAELEGMDLTEAVLMDGEIKLRAASCATCLHVLDDDKKHRVNQQLLTDLFQKMNVGKKNSVSSSSSSAASVMMMTDHLSTSSSSLPLISMSASSASSSSFSSNWNSSNPGTFQLAPSSFSSSLQAASAHMFAGNGISPPSSQ